MFERNDRRNNLAGNIIKWVVENKPIVITYEEITSMFGVERDSKDWAALFSANGIVRRKLQTHHAMVYLCEPGVAFRLVRPQDALTQIVGRRGRRADRQISKGVKELQTVDVSQMPENHRPIALQTQSKWEQDRKKARAQMSVIRANQEN